MAGVLFEDIFNVKDIDPTGKQFDRGKCFAMYIIVIAKIMATLRLLLPFQT